MKRDALYFQKLAMVNWILTSFSSVWTGANAFEPSSLYIPVTSSSILAWIWLAEASCKF